MRVVFQDIVLLLVGAYVLDIEGVDVGFGDLGKQDVEILLQAKMVFDMLASAAGAVTAPAAGVAVIGDNNDDGCGDDVGGSSDGGCGDSDGSGSVDGGSVDKDVSDNGGCGGSDGCGGGDSNSDSDDGGGNGGGEKTTIILQRECRRRAVI